MGYIWGEGSVINYTPSENEQHAVSVFLVLGYHPQNNYHHLHGNVIFFIFHIFLGELIRCVCKRVCVYIYVHMCM